jgi:hypothetical protein
LHEQVVAAIDDVDNKRRKNNKAICDGGIDCNKSNSIGSFREAFGRQSAAVGGVSSGVRGGAATIGAVSRRLFASSRKENEDICKEEET